MEIETSTVAGSALVKIFGVPIVASAAATSLGFMFMWPTTLKEAFIRFLCTIISSVVLGPILVVILRSWWPALFDSASATAVMYGLDPTLGFLFIAGPVLVMAGLPAWWVIGAAVRWLDKRKDKDIGELAADAAGIVKDVRSAL